MTLSLVSTLDGGLSQYCRSIIRPHTTLSHHQQKAQQDDFVYVTCGYGVYVVRPEQKRATLIQTSKVAGLIEFVNKRHT